MAEKPLVSFAVIAYKQERFIREAVQSAFAQTYEPLEIILSDDCSPDRTFEIIKEEASTYRGPHKIVINKNITNVGLAENMNGAVKLATGPFVIVQAGDDISLPERTALLVRASQEPTPVDMVCSDAFIIDVAGNVLAEHWYPPLVAPLILEDAVASGSVNALGCACAYSRSLWTKYGPINEDVLQEDTVLPFRALLERGIRVVDLPLVKYRIHGNNLHFGTRAHTQLTQSRDQNRRWAVSSLAIAKDWSAAWTISGRTDPVIDRRLRLTCRKRQDEVDCYDFSRAHAALVALRGLCNGLLSIRHAAGVIKRHVLRMG